jgi:hypothetical protein
MIGRLKFDIDTLVNQILNQIPNDVIVNGTVLDPAIGGGQFVKEVERRKRAAGKTDAEIAKTVVGIEQNVLRKNYAVNKHKLVGNYKVANFLEKDFKDMKFDVIVENPPYQSGKGEKGGKHSLWRKFVKKSFDLLNKDGYIAVVCPGFPYQANDLSKCFTNNTPHVLVNDVTDHFPGVGSDIKYWIVQEGKHKVPFMVDGVHWPNGLKDDPTSNPVVIGIKKKLSAFSVFECKQDKGYNSTQYKNDSSDYFDSPQGISIYPIRHASTVKTCYVSKPTECHNKNKVMMTFSGYPDFEYFDGKTNPMSSCYQMSGYIEVKNTKEGKNLINLYKTKLYTFLSSLDGAGMRGTNNYCLPRVDLSVVWSDKALYQYFGLDQDEINFIEDAIK